MLAGATCLCELGDLETLDRNLPTVPCCAMASLGRQGLPHLPSEERQGGASLLLGLDYFLPGFGFALISKAGIQ